MVLLHYALLERYSFETTVFPQLTHSKVLKHSLQNEINNFLILSNLARACCSMNTLMMIKFRSEQHTYHTRSALSDHGDHLVTESLLEEL